MAICGENLEELDPLSTTGLCFRAVSPAKSYVNKILLFPTQVLPHHHDHGWGEGCNGASTKSPLWKESWYQKVSSQRKRGPVRAVPQHSDRPSSFA